MSTDADKEYLRRHNIPALFNDITQDLFKARPENPVQYLIDLLKKKKAERDSNVGGGNSTQANPSPSSTTE